MTITIYAECLPEVEKKLAKIAKKAISYNVPFSYSVGEEHPQTINIMRNDSLTNTTIKVGQCVVSAVDITIDSENLICSNGWTVCARIEHNEHGNIVFPLSDDKIQPQWYTLSPKCDHCHTNRARKVTFIVKHENGEIKQIGKSCLKEYTGIDPCIVTLQAEVKDLNETKVDYTYDEWIMSSHITLYDIVTVLAHACDIIKQFGYVKTNELNSTRNRIKNRLTDDEKPSQSGLEEAKKIIDWLQNINTNDASNLIQNCISIVSSGYIKYNYIGLLAYIPMIYNKQMEQIETKKTESDYVGKIGERITIQVNKILLIKSWENYYGMTFLYEFFDTQGNTYVWFASSAISSEKEKFIMKATVKEHREWNGIKQTIVTRCRISK